MINVPQVQADALFPREPVPPVNPRPSCHPGFEIKPTTVLQRTVCRLSWDPRSRANNAHITFQNIEELRDFIQRPKPEQPSYPRNTCVVLYYCESGTDPFCTDVHVAKFVATKISAVSANSILNEQHRTVIIQLNGQRN